MGKISFRGSLKMVGVKAGAGGAAGANGAAGAGGVRIEAHISAICSFILDSMAR